MAGCTDTSGGRENQVGGTIPPTFCKGVGPGRFPRKVTTIMNSQTTDTTCHCGAEKETHELFDRETGEVVGEETVCPMRWHPAHPES